MNPLIGQHSQKTLQLAVVESQRLNSEFIGTGHILLALLADSNGPIDFVGDLETVRCEVGKLVQSAPYPCLLYTSPSPRDRTRSRMPSSA